MVDRFLHVHAQIEQGVRVEDAVHPEVRILRRLRTAVIAAMPGRRW